MTTKHICVACNEDGFGPSAFAYYVVRAIVEKWREEVKNGDCNFELKIWVLNKSAYDFNGALYLNFTEVCPKPLDCFVKLIKVKGEVYVRKTLDYLDRYDKEKKRYVGEVQPYLENCDMAIDIGVPLFVWSAKERKEKEIAHRITLFDHSWARTLKGICSNDVDYDYNPKPNSQDRQKADELAAKIANDERHATEVFLFQHYITPPEFLEHWQKLQKLKKKSAPGFKLNLLPGVLGSHNEDDSLKILNQMFGRLKQEPVLKGAELVLISPGGTPVWDDLLPKMIDQYIDRKSSNYILVFSNLA